MSSSHETYLGLGVLWSSERPLTFARASMNERTPDIILEQTDELDDLEAASWTRVHRMPDFPGGPVLEISTRDDHRCWAVTYTGWSFVWTRETSRILYAERGGHEVSFRHVIERVIAPLVRMTRNPALLAMHGSALAWGGRAHVVLGASGSGKSTTVRAMLERGALVLADDMVLVDVERGVVLPGAPTLRTWGEVPAYALEREEILGSPEKHWVRLPDARAASSAYELGSVLVLQRTRESGAAPAPGRVDESTGLSALASVLGQRFHLTHPPRSWSPRRQANPRRPPGRSAPPPALPRQCA